MSEERDRVGAIIVAAGSSRRMGGVDKVWAQVGSVPLLARVVEVFGGSPLIDEVVVVLGRGNLAAGRRLAQERGWSKVVALCPGGPRRQDSVRAGLDRLSGCRWVVIHDGARPCVTPELIAAGLEAVQGCGAAIAAVPVKDTIKVVSRHSFVQETPRRENLWAVQTPQVFDFDLIREAHRQATGEATDDAALVEQLGYRVRVYLGSYENIKVTTPEDLALVEVVLKNRERLAFT